MIDIHIPTMEIPEDSPFKYDRLNRITDVLKFKKLLSNLKSGVICLNAPWGDGKTTFIRLLQTYMDQNQREELHIKTIYYNAWEHDYEGNPFPSIVRTILNEFDDSNSASLKEILKESAKSIFKTMYTFSSFAAHVVNPALGEVVSAGKAALDDTLSDIFSDDSEPIDAIKKFQKDIQTILHSENKDSPIRIVLFIDELDRCRPTFAIETLEQIKHIFGTENMIFVLSLDKEQLANAIGTIYGANYNANGYLSRFFDMEFSLKNVHPFQNRIQQMGGSLSGIIMRVMNSISLRERLRILKRVDLCSHLMLQSGSFDYDQYQPYILFFMVLQYISPESCRACLQTDSITKEVFWGILDKLNLKVENLEDDELDGYIIAMTYCLSKDEYVRILSYLDPNSRAYRQFSKFQGNTAEDRASSLQMRKLLFDIIELSGDFDFPDASI